MVVIAKSNNTPMDLLHYFALVLSVSRCYCLSTSTLLLCLRDCHVPELRLLFRLFVVWHLFTDCRLDHLRCLRCIGLIVWSRKVLVPIVYTTVYLHRQTRQSERQKHGLQANEDTVRQSWGNRYGHLRAATRVWSYHNPGLTKYIPETIQWIKLCDNDVVGGKFEEVDLSYELWLYLMQEFYVCLKFRWFTTFVRC